MSGSISESESLGGCVGVPSNHEDVELPEPGGVDAAGELNLV